MKFDHDADDLLVLARRGDLSDTDARRLRDTLAASAEARLLYEAGRAFDREAPVLAGDDELIAAIQRNVQKRMRPAGASRRAWAVRLCVAAALITGAAVGARSFLEPTTQSAEHGAPIPPAPATTVAPPTAAPAEPTPSAEPTPPEPAPVAAPPPPATAPPPRTTLVHVDETAAITPAPDAAIALPKLSAPELFAAANRARVDGDAARSVTLSRELEERFPESREAVSTHLSLGLLYLQQGAAADALVEFRRYRAVGTPSTMPDALWGESRALRQLGRVADERAVLQDLLDHYSSSAYAAAARRRLAELR